MFRHLYCRCWLSC